MAKTLQYRWVICLLLSFGYVLVYFHRLCPAVLAVDLMRDLKASGSMTGFLGAAYFYPYALMQLPAGLLSDSWGPRNTITFFFIVAFIGSIILGTAPTPFWAIAGRTIVGLGVAMLFVPTMKIFAEWFEKKQFGLMAGLLMAVGGIGSLTASTPLVWLSAAVGWRNSFILIGIFTLLLAGLVRFFVYDRPSDIGLASLTGGSTGITEAIGLSEGIKMVLTCGPFWPLAFLFFFDFATFFTIAGLWGGPYLMQVYGMSKAEAGHILTTLAVGIVLGSLLLTWLSDRVFHRRKPVVVMCCIVMVLVTSAFYRYTDQIPVWGLYGLFFILSVCGSAVGAVMFAMNKDLFPVRITGTATGLVNLFPFAGAAVFQPLAGYILERYGKTGEAFQVAGYRAVFLILLGCAVIALICAVMTSETRKKA